jgi:hypothetical protein
LADVSVSLSVYSLVQKRVYKFENRDLGGYDVFFGIELVICLQKELVVHLNLIAQNYMQSKLKGCDANVIKL